MEGKMAKSMAISLLLHLFLLSSPSFLAFCASEAVDPRPRELRSFKIQEIKKEKGRSSCSYTVKIKTSCSSPSYTRDWISLAFGDAYNNQVYAPRLDNPSSGAFERCSTDTFKIQGPCGYGVCYLYLRRDGQDGWTPEWVKIYEPGAQSALTFYYGSRLPNGIWYGFNHCPSVSSTLTE
ncbi:embryo-specific protein ATS3A-like [Zingiber officinale]|uniref:Uncharacterized protein n=1 Tax=Zingiber officinale TaxID=94328 RepID=A0A8J5F812_ZINOF|nr:embryo-specific protein ATS3A-like [Zingiber officinale]KAG6481814.1 hypothetical protein ZIOFF_058435 [Zingiber officinale]